MAVCRMSVFSSGVMRVESLRELSTLSKIITQTLRTEVHSLKCPFIYSFNIHTHLLIFSSINYLLSNYYVSCTCCDGEVNRMAKILDLIKLELYWGRQIII